MLFVGIKDSKVQAVYTNAIGWSYTDSVYSLYDGYVGTYDWYMTDKRNNSGVYITLYGDKYNSNKAYGIKIEKTVSGYSSYQAYTSAKKLDLLGMSASEQQTTLDDYADAEIYLINAMRTRANNMNYINISNRNMLVKDSFCMECRQVFIFNIRQRFQKRNQQGPCKVHRKEDRCRKNNI